MANRYRSSALAGALILSTAGPGWADRSITLDDALAMARVHNRDLQAARERVVEAEAGVAQAEAAAINAAVARNQAALGAQPPVVIQKLNQLDGTVNAAVPLVSPP